MKKDKYIVLFIALCMFTYLSRVVPGTITKQPQDTVKYKDEIIYIVHKQDTLFKTMDSLILAAYKLEERIDKLIIKKKYDKIAQKAPYNE